MTPRHGPQYRNWKAPRSEIYIKVCRYISRKSPHLHIDDDFRRQKYTFLNDNHLLKRLPSSSAQQLIPETLADAKIHQTPQTFGRQLREPSVLIQFEEQKHVC